MKYSNKLKFNDNENIINKEIKEEDGSTGEGGGEEKGDKK